MIGGIIYVEDGVGIWVCIGMDYGIEWFSSFSGLVMKWCVVGGWSFMVVWNDCSKSSDEVWKVEGMYDEEE